MHTSVVKCFCEFWESLCGCTLITKVSITESSLQHPGLNTKNSKLFTNLCLHVRSQCFTEITLKTCSSYMCNSQLITQLNDAHN